MLKEDPTLQHNNLVHDTIDRFKKENELSKKLADGNPCIQNPQSFTFHPRYIKKTTVINSIKCHTSEISRFVDHHIQPLVRENSSYIKNIMIS